MLDTLLAPHCKTDLPIRVEMLASELRRQHLRFLSRMLRLPLQATDLGIRVALRRKMPAQPLVLGDELFKNLLLVAHMETDLAKGLGEYFDLMLLSPCRSSRLVRLPDIRVTPLDDLDRHVKMLLQECTQLDWQNPIAII